MSQSAPGPNPAASAQAVRNAMKPVTSPPSGDDLVTQRTDPEGVTLTDAQKSGLRGARHMSRWFLRMAFHTAVAGCFLLATLVLALALAIAGQIGGMAGQVALGAVLLGLALTFILPRA